MKQSILTVAMAVIMLTVWMLCYKKSYDTPRKRRKATLWIGSHFRGNAKIIYYFLVLIIYLGLPMLFGWLLLSYTGTPYVGMFTLDAELSVNPAYLTALGFFGGVTVTILSTNLMLALLPQLDIPNNINRVAWIEATMEFPKPVVWVFPFMSACVEELFFRGACLFAFVSAGIPPLWAALIVTAMFVANQCYLCDNAVQGVVIGTGSLFISLIGCLMVSMTGSVLPSMAAHAIYAAFFVNSNNSFDTKGYAK